MKRYLQKLFTIQKENVSRNNTMSSLAPKILSKPEDIEKIQPYLDKLHETISTKGINNIALTGGYGSGKSTIIGTFKNLYSQYEFLNISLASFNQKKGEQTKSKNNSKKEELERLLEVSILQQIFYHVKPQEIPESRFKRIINIPNWKAWSIAIAFVIWVSCTTLLFKYDYLDKINPNSWDVNYDFDWVAIVMFLVSCIGLGAFSKLIANLFTNSKINKVNIKGELELGDNVNKSVFNEHLEEILYFFERTKFDVVVIEDLDRFDSTDIFTKLREINILLNNSKLINREISFIYAVGDDLFDDKMERVKFFEYIIPVIPFINSSNADEQLITLIKESGLDEAVFPKDFITDVTAFIDDIDMRLLTNIFHEFVIYRKTLKPEFIKGNHELFAMITYKNIEPKDFTKLNRKEGKLYELIHNKKNYVTKLISEIDVKINVKKLQIQDIENHVIVDCEELKNVYFLKILTTLPENALVNIENTLEEFDTIIENQRLSYDIHDSYHNRKSSHVHSFRFSEIESKINPNYTYKKRVELIESKHINKADSLKKEVERSKSKKVEIENWDLKQIFNEVDIDEYLNDFSNNDLLRNFILNGYINENYNDYISLFHEVSITKEDKIFETNVRAGHSADYNYKLSNKIENLVARIDERYFVREAILNFDLLDFLGQNYREYTHKYDSIIRLLSNEKEKSVMFIDEYIKDEDRPLHVFIEKLVGNWNGFWDYIYSKSNHSDDRENKYLELIIRFSKVETILKNQNNNDTLRTAIEEKTTFLSLIKNTKELDYFGKITKLLKELSVKFERLDNPNKETKGLFEYVFNNDHYRINRQNLLQMFLLFGKESSEHNFNGSNYSAILASDSKPLINYVNSNIQYYVDDVYLTLEHNNFEDENNLIILLNDDRLKGISKSKIIQKAETKVSDLTKITETEIKTELLINQKTVPNWDNVTDYFTASEHLINENLIKYLSFEDSYTLLSDEKMTFKSESFDYPSFREKLLLCDELSDESYKSILKSITYTRDILSFEHLNEVKVVCLVNNILNTSPSNYNLLRENFADYHITLIEKNFAKFIEKIDDFETNESDISLLLKSAKISTKDKFTYASSLEESLIMGNLEISKTLGNIILQKSDTIEFGFGTIEALIKATNSKENKIRLINLYTEDFDNDELIKITSLVGWSYTELFKKQHRPTFDDTSYNQTLFNILKNRGLIKSFGVYTKDKSKIRVIANY